jgi:nucleoside-diphosphate-sugar epimerase
MGRMSDHVPNEDIRTRRCLISGASGYLGSRFKNYLTARDWSVTELRRQPTAGVDSIHFDLGSPIDHDLLRGYDALVHCAYDFREVGWAGIHSKNVEGSRRLMESARAAGVGRIVFISTISAFDGCRSLYGKSKLEVEQVARELGAWTIRPGLVFSDNAGAMFGQLVANIRHSKILPMPGAGKQPMFLVHEADLAEAVLRCLDPSRPLYLVPITVAHEQMWPFRDMLYEIARTMNRNIILIPIPWRLIWLVLRTAETLRLPIGLRSDSLVSLVYQNATPNLNAKDVLGMSCRPFGTD